MNKTSVRQRALALGLGGVLTVGALWGALWVLLLVAIAGQPPDAAAIDGDPCCPVPGSWGEVAGLSALTLALALADAAVLVLGMALLIYGVRLRSPSRRAVWLPLWAVPACAGLIVFSLTVRAIV
jgi:hypothetical protein